MRSILWRGLAVVLTLFGASLSVLAQNPDRLPPRPLAVTAGAPVEVLPPTPLEGPPTSVPPPVTIVPGLPLIDNSPPEGHKESKASAWLFDGDYLLMAARRRGNDFAILGSNPLFGPVGVIKSLDGSYDSGFRVGVGYRFPGEGIEVAARYLFLNSQNDQSVTRGDGQTLFATATHPALVVQVNSAAAKDSVNLNVFDLEVAKRFEISESLKGRVFAGPRYANIDQKFSAVYQGVDVDRDEVNRRLTFGGAGIRAGGEVGWNFFENLGAYFRGSASLLTGKFHADLNETANGATVVSVSDKFTRVVPVLDLGLGIHYQRGNWKLSVGYEFSSWFDMVNGIDFIDDAHPAKFTYKTGNLGFDGIVFRSELAF